MKHKNLKCTVVLMLALVSMLPSFGKGIVPDSMLEDRQFGMATNFLQRYQQLLSTPDSEEKSDRIRRVKEDGFKYTKGNDRSFMAIPEDADFSIDFNKGVYTASWSTEGKTLVECNFPAKVGLMKIEDKKGLELLMIEKFRGRTSSADDIPLPTATIKEVSKLPFSDFYIKSNDTFITSNLSNQIIYLPSKEAIDKFEMVYDSGKFPVETISNIMMTGYSKDNLGIDLKIKQYGYGATDVPTTLSTLYDIFSEEGCDPYWGLKETTGDVVKGLYIWKNDMGGYCHVVSMEVPLEALSSKCNAKATLHCYVRLDNLKSLFADYPEL